MEANEIAVKEVVSASKKLQADTAKAIAKESSKIIVAKGKSLRTFKGGDSYDKDAIEAATQKLTEASGQLAQRMYAEEAQTAQGAGDAGADPRRPAVRLRAGGGGVRGRRRITRPAGGAAPREWCTSCG